MEKEKFNKIISKSIKECEIFFKKHWKNANELTMVLKSHLFVENCLDKFFLLAIPKPKHILRKSFYDKVMIFDALNYSPDKELITKLLAINTLRNKYAHNLNYKLKLKDIKSLLEGVDIKSRKNKVKLARGLASTMSYLYTTKALFQMFPFATTCYINRKIFEKEKACKMDKIIKKIYPNDEKFDIVKSW